MAKAKSKNKEKGISPVREQNRGRRNREFDFGKHLAPIHGDNPDDWIMIYNHSYYYILDHWENRKAFAPEGGSRDDEEGAYFAETNDVIGSLAQIGNDDRETCLQDAFVLLIYKQPVFTTLGQARAWLAYTAANLAGTEYKNRKKGTLDVTDPYLSEEAYERKYGFDFNNMIERVASQQLDYEADPNYRADYDIDSDEARRLLQGTSKRRRNKRGRQAARGS